MPFCFALGHRSQHSWSHVSHWQVSKQKYGTLLRQLGGWPFAQRLLAVLARIGRRKGVSASAVAQKWVLQQPQVRGAAGSVFRSKGPDMQHSLYYRTRRARYFIDCLYVCWVSIMQCQCLLIATL